MICKTNRGSSERVNVHRDGEIVRMRYPQLEASMRIQVGCRSEAVPVLKG